MDHNLFNQFFITGDWDCFKFFIIINNTAINFSIFTHTHTPVTISWWHIPRSTNAIASGKNIFLQDDLAKLPSRKVVTKCIPSHAYQLYEHAQHTAARGTLGKQHKCVSNPPFQQAGSMCSWARALCQVLRLQRQTKPWRASREQHWRRQKMGLMKREPSRAPWSRLISRANYFTSLCSSCLIYKNRGQQLA